MQQQRREQRIRDRNACNTLRATFPHVRFLRVELEFRTPSAFTPAAQVHVLHPAARTYLVFPCPCTDCDGTFDLGAVASRMLQGSASRKEGTLECFGARAYDPVPGRRCGVSVRYALSTEYLTRATTEGDLEAVTCVPALAGRESTPV